MRQNDDLRTFLSPLLPAGCSITRSTHLSELWAGYGHIYRIHISSPSSSSSPDDVTYIVKTICPPPTTSSQEYDEGHVRKMLSYRVEANFYRDYAAHLTRDQAGCCIPKLFPSSSSSPAEKQQEDRGQVLIMEDLSLRFPVLTEKRGTLSDKQVSKSLEWLASFHAASWGIESSSKFVKEGFCPSPSEGVKTWGGKGLWQQGGYHYLSTRMEELSSIDPQHDLWGQLGLHYSSDLPFAIEWCLNNPLNRTRLSLIHGDVKAANMAFSRDATQMAMYDFQYVGLGLGVQDLAKFLTTSIPRHHLCDTGREEKLLTTYHGFLVERLPKGAEYEFQELMRDWELALVSWVRFLAGWSGGFWGNVDWLQGRVEALLKDQDWVEGVRERWKSGTQAQT